MKGFCLGLGLVLLSACVPVSQHYINNAKALAAEEGFSASYLRTTPFTLFTVSKVKHPVQNAVVYLEGDGRAWISAYQVSPNPTPAHPVALQLALRDDVHNGVFYIARPCQYHLVGKDAACKPHYWLARRYGQTVVDSLSQALDQLKATYSLKALHLVGYSGGGTLALLVAKGRDDILSVRTVAGNLDTKGWVQHHQLSPLNGSLNPADYTKALIALPQVHFMGDKDSIVPPVLSARYIKNAQDHRCVSSHTVKGFDHRHNWVDEWPQLLQVPLPCFNR